jgi:hypothetical protein
MLKAILDFFTMSHEERRRKAIENYLARSTDLVDLERRQRNLMNGNITVL